ncbi:MAG: tetratricopeptide repeat protein [Acidobacteriota bacterium]
MFRKNYFTFLLMLALFAVSGSVVFAQTAPVSGRIEMKKADGSSEPVAGALVEVFRTDQKGKFPSDKTGKKGDFAFAGLPLGATFAFSISGPKIAPRLVPNIRAGADNLVIVVAEGDGKKMTEEEVRQSLAAPAASTTNTGAATAEAPVAAKEMTAEQKKAKEEYDKQVTEVNSKNEKAKNANAIISKVVAEGSKAFEAKNYDLAITKFDEGINADPDFAGSAPVLLNNKALSLKSRAVDNYNKAIKGDPSARASALESVKTDFNNATAATDRALEILKNAKAPDAEGQKNYDATKLNALTIRKEVYGLMALTGVDKTKGKEAVTAYDEYITAEPDAQKKAASRLGLAEAYQQADQYDESITEYEKVLAEDPENVDALVGAGLALVNMGYISQETDKEKAKAQFQQSINYLQKFVDLSKSPKNQDSLAVKKYKDDAEAIIDTLKKEQSVAPQKNAKKKP